MSENPFLCTEETAKGSEDVLIPGKWYWWDETEQLNEQPFDTKEAAEADLNAYCKNFLGEAKP